MELNIASIIQNAKLPFIKIGIAPVKDAIPDSTTSAFTQIQAIYDSGASNSLMSETLHNTLNRNGQFPLQQSESILRLADESKMMVKGEITTYINVHGTNGNYLSFPTKVTVIKNLRRNFFIGNDILSTRVYIVTNDAIIFSKVIGKKYNMSRIKNNPNLVTVPFESVVEKEDTISLASSRREELKHNQHQDSETQSNTNSDSLLNEAKRIADEFSIDDQDKELFFKDATEKQTLEIPISNYINNNSKVQSIEMEDFKNTFTTVEQLIQLIGIDHLPSALQSKFTQCCKDNLHVFSKFQWDVGRSKSTTAFVELTTDRQITQKFYPIQPNVQSEVEEILEKMLQIGVIKESDPNERSQFVNCLLVTRRKNKKIEDPPRYSSC